MVRPVLLALAGLVGLALAALLTLALWRERKGSRLLRAAGLRGRLGRELLPAGLGMIFLLGAAQVALVESGRLSVPAATALLVLTTAGVFAGLVLGVARVLARFEEQQRQAAHEREQLIAHLQKTVAEVTRLQSGMVTMCAWTRKIKDEERWVSFEEFLRAHLGVEVTHGISEEGHAQLLRERAASRNGSG